MLTADQQSQRAMAAWYALPWREKRAAIRRLSTEGMSSHGISAATGLRVEAVREVLGKSRDDRHG